MKYNSTLSEPSVLKQLLALLIGVITITVLLVGFSLFQEPELKRLEISHTHSVRN
ncbi:MAG: hypothetical protein AAGI38_04310 [Bacteroidota bacterium]